MNKRNRKIDPQIEMLMNNFGISYNAAYVRLRRMKASEVSLEDYMNAGGITPRIAQARSEVEEIMKRHGMTRKRATEWRNYCKAWDKDPFEAPKDKPAERAVAVPEPVADEERHFVLTNKGGKWQRATNNELTSYVKTCNYSKTTI